MRVMRGSTTFLNSFSFIHTTQYYIAGARFSTIYIYIKCEGSTQAYICHLTYVYRNSYSNPTIPKKVSCYAEIEVLCGSYDPV